MTFRTHVKPKELSPRYGEDVPNEFGYYYVAVYDAIAKSYCENIGVLDEYGWRVGVCSVSNKEITEKYKKYRYYLIGPPLVSLSQAVQVDDLIQYVDNFIKKTQED